VQSSNAGGFERDAFAVVPEFGATLGCQLTPLVRASVGYTFLYWSDVFRPEDQIDLSHGAERRGGPNHPLAPLAGTDFWAQGLHCGLEFKY
jgi:hypothetical protein